MALTDYITDQCNAIREKDGTTAPIPYTEIASRIRAIPTGGDYKEWQPHPDWWNIKTMVDTGVLEWSGEHIDSVRYGYVVSDGHPTTKLVAGYEYYLSDGSYYNGAATHTWDRSRDKPCSEGYTTRAVIVVKAANRDVAISQRSIALDGIASLYIYLGDCNVTAIAQTASTLANANRCLRAILSSTPTTANDEAFNVSQLLHACYALASIAIPQGVTSIGAAAFQNCYALASIAIPQGVTSIGDYAFTNCYALAIFNAPVGFNISVTLSSSPLLSPASLEQLITNAADMSGQTAITFTLGAANLAKLSEEYIQLAAAKNITLA